MIKFIFTLIFINLIIIKNKMLIFYSNSLYFIRFMIIFIFIFKENL